MSLQEIPAAIPKLSDAEIEILEEALGRRCGPAPTVFELRGDLLEGVDGLPPDLSTNPEYVRWTRTMTLADTDPIVALVNRADRFHGWAIAQTKVLPGPLHTCEPGGQRGLGSNS